MAAIAAAVAPVRRQRITDVGKGDDYNSFIREYLCELTSCLSSDGAVGGHHNLIRDRVREIVQDNEQFGAGRSALDTRFALGHDDDKYLSTAVMPLWASFDSDKNLDLAADVPMEVREASAVGMLGHFRKMLDQREIDASNGVKTAADFVAWLLGMPEIRTAVLYIAERRGLTPEARDQIKDTYGGDFEERASRDTNAGVAYVRQLADNASDEKLRNLRALFEAVFVLLDPENMPMKRSRDFDEVAFKKVVDGARVDTQRLMQSFLIFGDLETPTDWCRPERFTAADGKVNSAAARRRRDEVDRALQQAQAESAAALRLADETRQRQQRASEFQREAERQQAQGVLADQIDRTVRVQQQRDQLEAERNRLQAELASYQVFVQQLNQQLRDVELDNQEKSQLVVQLEDARADIEQRLADLANDNAAEIRQIADEGARALARVQAAAEADKQAAIEAKDAQIAQAQDNFERGMEDLQRRATDQLEQERLASVLRARLVERRERAEQDLLRRELTAEQRVSIQVENLRVAAEQYREEAESDRAAMQVDLEAISVSRATAERARAAAQAQVDALQRRVAELEQQQREQAQAAAREAGANADEPLQEGESWSSWIGRVVDAVDAAARAANPGMADLFDSDTDAAAGASAGMSSTMQALFKAQPPMPREDATGAPGSGPRFTQPGGAGGDTLAGGPADDGAGALGPSSSSAAAGLPPDPREALILELQSEKQQLEEAIAEMATKERIERLERATLEAFAVECPPIDVNNRVSLPDLGSVLYRAFKRVSLDATDDADLLAAGWSAASTVSPFLRSRTEAAWQRFLDTSDRPEIVASATAAASPASASSASASSASASATVQATPVDYGYRLSGQLMQDLEFLTEQLDNGFARREGIYRTQYRIKPADLDDAVYIEYAVLRGLCALRGPHQALVDDDRMLYTFPSTALRRQEAILKLSADVTVSPNDRASMQSAALHAYTDIPDSAVRNKNIDPVAPLIRAESKRRGDAVPLEDATGTSTGQEHALEVLWAPLTSVNPANNLREVLFNSRSGATCKAACLESLMTYLKQLRAQAVDELESDDAFPLEPAIDAIVASTKLRQLESIALVATNTRQPVGARRPTDAENIVTDPRQSSPNERLITRPPYHCYEVDETGQVPGREDDARVAIKTVFPVAAGIGRLTADREVRTSPGIPAPTRYDWQATVMEGCPNDRGTGATMSRRLQDGMDSLRRNDQRTSDFEMYFAGTTQQQPWQEAETRQPRAFGEAANTNPACVTLDRMTVVMLSGLSGLEKISQLGRERDLLTRLEDRGSVERRELFGLYENDPNAMDPNTQRVTMEMASRNRRSAIWEQALRKLNVSGDRLLDFIKLFSGAVNESMEWVLEQSDPELQESQKRIQQRRKEIAQRTMQFQTRITEAVLNSALKDAKLTMGLKSAGEGLVILDSEERENFKQLASGATGRAFFDASVALQQAADGGGKPQSISTVLGQLQEVGSVFHQYLNKAFVSGDSIARLSPETLADSANCFCVRLKPEAYAAIKMAHQDLYRELQHHYHPLNRMPSVWELVEGRNGQMCTAFANLCALKLKHTQFTSGSLAAYAGRDVRYSNAMEYQRIRGRLINIVCEYVVHQGRPDFLVEGGREFYFGARRAVDPQDTCFDRPVRPGYPVSESDDSDDPMSDDEAQVDRRNRLQREKEQAELVEKKSFDEQLQFDRGLLDRLQTYERRQDRIREELFDKLQGQAMVAGGRGLLRRPPTQTVVDLRLQQAAIADIATEMRNFMQKQKGNVQMLGRKLGVVLSAFISESQAVAQAEPCEAAFSDPINIGVCKQLERRFPRLYDGQRTVLKQPTARKYLEGFPQMQLGVQIDLQELRAYVQASNGRTAEITDQEISDALNTVFWLDSRKAAASGQDWQRLESTPADAAGRAAQSKIYFIREYHELVLAREEEAVSISTRLANIWSVLWERLNFKNIFYLCIALFLVVQLSMPGSTVYRLISGSLGVTAQIVGVITKFLKGILGVAAGENMPTSWLSQQLDVIGRQLGIYAREVGPQQPIDYNFAARFIGFFYDAGSKTSWWGDSGVSGTAGAQALSDLIWTAPAAGAADALSAVASSTIIVVQHTTSSTGPSALSRKKQKTAVGASAAAAAALSIAPARPPVNYDPRSAWERATHANATESMQREERWATEAIRAEAQAKKPGAWPMGRPGFEGRGGWLWSVDGAS
jgi:hypothetical protein